jgi:hypothetical protein
MSWKVEVFVEGQWVGNGLVFATSEDAEDYGKDLHRRWTMAKNWRTIETDSEVNYRNDKAG